jgi:hypothetical protein
LLQIVEHAGCELALLQHSARKTACNVGIARTGKPFIDSHTAKASSGARGAMSMPPSLISEK